MKSGFVPSKCFESRRTKSTLPLFVVKKEDYKEWLASAPSPIGEWLKASSFSPRVGACALLPQEHGVVGAVVIVSDGTEAFDYADAPRTLPKGTYEAEPELSCEVADALALGWALGCYTFERYKKRKSERPRLVWPEEANQKWVLGVSEGICLARDLINTPASDMGPEELSRAAKDLAKTHQAKCKLIVGDALLKENFPMIHAVGRASDRAPRLIDLVWGRATDPKLTLVGKGVCFDTGGLDLKPAQYMKLMKKDMGGGALVLGLAHALMSRKLPVRLRVLVCAVENSVAGNAMRPLDVLTSRQGITVEVGDTDAEGRLVLADALTLASSESPDLIFDAATLTGAARVALGTAMPAVFTRRDSTYQALETASRATNDPIWRLPLHRPYRSKLNSKIADLSNISPDGYAGAITAALFLDEFVGEGLDWVHMDTMGYNLETRPGRPAGGEALGLLAAEHMLSLRYTKSDSTQKAGKIRSNRRSEKSKKSRTRKTGEAGGGKKKAPGKK